MSDTTMSDTTANDPRDGSLLPLRHGQSIRVSDRDDRQTLHLLSADGSCRLEIQITESGPVLMLNGAGLKVSVDGPLSFEAGKVSIHGRESMSLSTEGDFSLQCSGDLRSLARSQHIESELGDVQLKANDDIRLTGERVRVNC